MKGLELAKKYYLICAKEILEKDFSDIFDYLAIALIGSGSECYGFDDELSKDHDFEPGFCIFLPEKEIVDEKDPGPPIEVDWQELKSINEDIVAWIYIGSIDISYPVVKGKDNSYYLHRTFQDTYNFSGSIFMEYQNESNFSDPNTILYGHNMIDGSMFGKLSWIANKELYKNDPYFWILTPNRTYRYKMFSIKTVGVSDESYQQFSIPDDEFNKWIHRMKDRSSVNIHIDDLDSKGYVCTLSTCTGNDSTRLVVQGVRDRFYY